MEYTHLPHCVYHCEYHIVIVTKYRKAVFNEGILAYFKKKLAEVTEHYPLIKIGNVNHDKDHIHFLVSIPPTMLVGKFVGIIKQNTSRAKAKIPVSEASVLGNRSGMVGGIFCIDSWNQRSNDTCVHCRTG
jgi:REP element-mobilizing transposase RayT